MKLYHADGTRAACPVCYGLHGQWQRVPGTYGPYYFCGRCGEAAPTACATATEAVLAGALVVPHDDWGGEPLVYGKENA